MVFSMNERVFTLPGHGLEVTIGKFAQQADGAAWLRKGGTVVLSTACEAAVKDFPGFLPLSVDYRENFAAAGKIPGGYFKREGRYSDREVLYARLTDRAIRPLFPENYFNQLQVLTTVYSVDKENMPHTLGLLAASIALVISKIPFMEPVGAVEMAKVDGKWIVDPSYADLERAVTKIIVAGTAEGINMVEGILDEVLESDLIDAFFVAHDKIKAQVAWQNEIAAACGVVKNTSYAEQFNWSVWKERVKAFLTQERVKTIFKADKVERGAAQKALKQEIVAQYQAELAEIKGATAVVEYLFDKVLCDVITELCFVMGKRVDDRAFDEVRNISTEVALLPYAHGSALFTRGRTQGLVSVTLGGGQDVVKVDRLMGETLEKPFMLHYNFPPFSVGEVRPMRGPGRREVGHGYLASSGIEPMLPKAEQFPYTIRIVSDILESDGSSSMATVCGSTMALMDAGVPLKKMVSGIAMGLLQSSKGSFQVLTDMSGFEDAFGLMDFKVAGTADGITAIQMDIKYKGGLPRSLFEQALAAAHKGRLHIMGEMRKVMKEPRTSLSTLVPQVVTVRVLQDKIGAIIGTGGKVIREIIEKTGTSIDISDDGLVKIFGQPGEKLEQAINWVKTLGGVIEKGARYQGIVRRIVEFGIFVELVPGQDGLVHISAIPRAEQQRFMERIKPGDVLPVEVIEYAQDTGRIRLGLIKS